MCFSIAGPQNPNQLALDFGVDINLDEYERIFQARANGYKLSVTGAMESPFLTTKNPQGFRIQQSIHKHYRNLQQDLKDKISGYEEQISDLERKLAKRETKTNRNSLEAKQRQIVRFRDRLANAQADKSKLDERYFPRHYISAIVNDGERLSIMPVRYGIFRQTGSLIIDIFDDHDSGYGLYNCRRESLTTPRFMHVQQQLAQRRQQFISTHEKWLADLWGTNKLTRGQQNKRDQVERFLAEMQLTESDLEPCYPAQQSVWEPSIKQHHAIIVADHFFENVKLNDFEQRPLNTKEPAQNIQLMFSPEPHQPMYFPCLFHRAHFGNGQFLQGVAAITDQPNPEVAAKGHNRTPITLTKEAAINFLTTSFDNSEAMQQVLDQKQPFFFRGLKAA